MEPLYHPRLRDSEVEYAMRLRHAHDRIKSGILMMAGASTLYLKKAMNDDAYRYLLRRAEETYQEATQELRALEPPASLARLHRHYLEGFADYQTALHQLGKLVGSAATPHDRQWLIAVTDLMSEGTRKIKRVTLNLWLDEYITEHGDEIAHHGEEIEAEIRRVEAASACESPEIAREETHHDGQTNHTHAGPHHHA